MKRMTVVMTACACLGIAAGAWGEGGAAQKTAATTASRPKVEIDLKDPQAALKTYFLAQQTLDSATIKKVIVISDTTKAGLADVTITYYLWSHYLERQAIAKFGEAEGMTVLSHLRSLDEQLTMDLKRVVLGNVDYSTDRTKATIYLRVERNRPEGLQTDQYTFLDSYHLVKDGSVWKVDYLKTYGLVDPEKEQQYQFNMGIFPKMVVVLKELSTDVRAGKYREASQVKNTLDTKWKIIEEANLPKEEAEPKE